MNGQEMTGQEKGNYAEALVEQALAYLKLWGEFPDFRKTEKNTAGRDFLVWLPNNRIVPLEVKSSLNGFRKHKTSYCGVPCVVVPHDLLNGADLERRHHAWTDLIGLILEKLKIQPTEEVLSSHPFI